MVPEVSEAGHPRTLGGLWWLSSSRSGNVAVLFTVFNTVKVTHALSLNYTLLIVLNAHTNDRMHRNLWSDVPSPHTSAMIQRIHRKYSNKTHFKFQHQKITL